MTPERAQRSLIIAVDVSTTEEAVALVTPFKDKVRLVKIGLELFVAEGPAVVVATKKLGFEVMLDLKLHDIPNTVEGAARSAAKLNITLLTVHAGGGPEMIAAAVKGAKAGAAAANCLPPSILAITMLTSINNKTLGEMWPKNNGTVAEAVLQLGTMAIKAGAGGLVCSPQEVKSLWESLGLSATLVVPATRLPGSDTHDQERTGTPGKAIADGANFLVVGRERGRLYEIVNDIVTATGS